MSFLLLHQCTVKIEQKPKGSSLCNAFTVILHLTQTSEKRKNKEYKNKRLEFVESVNGDKHNVQVIEYVNNVIAQGDLIKGSSLPFFLTQG